MRPKLLLMTKGDSHVSVRSMTLDDPDLP